MYCNALTQVANNIRIQPTDSRKACICKINPELLVHTKLKIPSRGTALCRVQLGFATGYKASWYNILYPQLPSLSATDHLIELIHMFNNNIQRINRKTNNACIHSKHKRILNCISWHLGFLENKLTSFL